MSEMQVTNAVIGAKLDAVGQRVEKIELKVDNLGSSYVPHDIFELRLKELETQISGFRVEHQKIWLELKRTSSHGRIQSWVTGTVSAAAGIILALLIEFYLAHVGAK